MDVVFFLNLFRIRDFKIFFHVLYMLTSNGIIEMEYKSPKTYNCLSVMNKIAPSTFLNIYLPGGMSTLVACKHQLLGKGGY